MNKEKETSKCVVEEKIINPVSGYLMLVMNIVLIAVSVVGFIAGAYILDGGENNTLGGGLTGGFTVLFVITMILFNGLKVNRPNEALVLTLFGKYYGTIMKPGFFFVNPFVSCVNPVKKTVKRENKGAKEYTLGASTSSRKNISLKQMTWNNGTQKVNDLLGNPVIIGAVVIWKVENPTKAVFNVEDYTEFLSIQTDSTIRNIARLYPYDLFAAEDEEAGNEKTLRGSSQEIADRMKEELKKKVEFAGLVIDEVRITHLSYAEEIAAAMLQRQQAEAIIAARTKIVDGAVSMVQMAIDKLSEEEIVVLDEERKAAMVSNLLVVLCSGKDAQPVINNGSIY